MRKPNYSSSSQRKSIDNLGQHRNLAKDLQLLAQVHAATGRMQAARLAANESLNLYERMGLLIKQAEVQKLIDSLPNAAV